MYNELLFIIHGKKWLLIARFIREHPQFRYTIKYDEYLNVYMLYYETDVAKSCLTIASGVSSDVLLKKITNGIVHSICEICFECDSYSYITCHMCAFRMCKKCFVLLIKNDTHIDGIHCPQCRTIKLDYALYIACKLEHGFA